MNMPELPDVLRRLQALWLRSKRFARQARKLELSIKRELLRALLLNPDILVLARGGLTLSQVAKAIDVSIALVHNFEQGKIDRMSTASLYKLLEAYSRLKEIRDGRAP